MIPEPVPVIPALEAVPYALLGSGKIAFHRLGTNGARGGIYVIDAAAATAHSVADPLTVGPSISPDGRRLAFTRYTDAATLYDVYVGNSDGTGIQRVTSLAGHEGPPTWTPDGAKIVYTSAPPALVYNVYSQSPVPNPGDVRQLTYMTAVAGVPVVCPVIISPDTPITVSAQGAMAFACNAGEIDVFSSSGTLSASYTATRDNRRRWPLVFSPSWSPDGTRLAFVEIATDSATNYGLVGFTVKIMNADAGNVITVATVPASRPAGGGGGFSLCWMPDGARLVFTVPESDLVGHIWVVRPDGTGLAQLTSAPNVWDRSVSCSR